AARHDHEGHADRDDQQERVVDQQAEQHLQREEAGVHHRAEAEQHREQHDGDDDGERARIEQPAERVVHCGVPVSGFVFTTASAGSRWRSSIARATLDWITLTNSTTTAFTTSVASGGTPIEYVVYVSVWMISAPSTVPARLKRPPSSDVPPSVTARIASSSSSRPALLPSALRTLELARMPAMAAVRPENT